jgi:HEPN domain-containing protein
VDRRDLQALSKIRVKEAKALLSAGLHDGAYYLAGYAVERALKACIAKETRKHEFPDKKRVDDSYTHSLRKLAELAELWDSGQDRSGADPEFARYWNTAQLWSEQSRYRRHSPEEAQQLVEAVDNRSHGVIAWLTLYW